MASPPKLTGETLIVHHIPLVHCQVPDRQCCSASKRTNPFCQPDLGLARPGPAPERDFLQADSLLYSSLLQAASTDLAPVKAAGHTEGQPRELTARRQNPFLQSGGGPPEPGPEDLGQRSFRLHGGRASLPPRERALPPFRLHDADPTGKPWSAASRFDVVEGREETRAGDEPRKGSGPECMELDEYGGPPGSLSSCSFEHEWAADPDELLLPDLEAGRSRTCSCSSSEPPRCRCCSLSSPSEPPDQQMGCLSDSSCNSSDGVLVNFSALYDKASGRARPCPAPGSLSCNSSSGSRSDSAAFYLDLHASPEEPGTSCESSPRGGGPGRACGCHRPPSPLLDANCNSYPALCEPGASEGSDLSACLQSKARLVVATQNYYKLVTCDLSSQSSPSPAGSSVASGSEERLRGSPLQPTEYYLFGRPGGPPEESDSEGSREGPQGPATDEALEGQVYVNVPPPAAAAGRQRSRSYDRGLERSPAGRLGTLERLLSCPVKLSQPELIPDAPPPKRVTSFAELAKGRKRNGSSPPLPAGRDPSLEYTAIPEYQDSPVFREEPPRSSQSLPPMPLARSLHRSCESYRRPEWGHSASRQNGGPREVPPCGPAAFEQPFFSAPAEAGASSASSHGQKDARARADGQPAKHPQLSYSDFFPDYFSLAEKPPAEFCLSPDGSAESVSVDLGQKKGLVKAINMAVDLIVAHFGTSRDPGVKAKLGNSSVSPNVGHLILKYLCPAVSSVLGDGLKAHVLDVIVGQRRNLPWSVVEASTQLGPSTKVLHSLCSRVSQCGELSSHAMRFNAFIFGLLNLRSLEFWFNHLYSHEDVIQAHYQPTGFLALAHGLCQGLFEEVLLLLQPLALLPFSLDLLFEHRLLQTGRTQRQQKELLCAQQGLVLSAHSTLQLMRAHGGGRPGSADGWAAAEQDAGPEGCRGSLGKEADAGADVGTGPGAPCSGRERRRARDGPAEPKKDRQASWWYQLMQSSQVYIEGAAEGAPRIRYERRKKALVEGAGRQGEPRRAPPPREGVVEGAEACPITEAALKGRAPPEEEPSRMQPSSAGEAAQEKGRPRWMGSPPDSVLTELKRVKEAEAESGLAPRPGSPEQHSAHGPGSGPPKWGHLFGSRKVPKEPRQASRLPSGWLNLDRSVFQLVAQTVGAGAWREAALEPRRQPAELSPPRSEGAGTWLDRSTPPEVPCGVKALCHHIATEAGQLSFRKGDVLRVLGKADADWLRCSRGAETGLVPIMYVTHVEDEDY
ncbi:iporin isoform X3 [Varanus komodoensis]|uniref:iporin isoform X3 n=1 Tax=Varanus komodoensis TaxID=61221 RepID=UPI001CF783A5|nr:iporin isoform X3 [Varanus komodoensis]